MDIAVNLGTYLSNNFALVDQTLSHSCKLVFLEGPYSIINYIKFSANIPLLIIPYKVGNLGSAHPSTRPSLTNQFNLRLDKVVFIKFNLEKS